MVLQKLLIGQKKLIMNNTPLVSILMNCFNGDRYLREAIDSVINQTYQNWELIFWDNQSTDKSKDIFFSYKDARFKYYYAVEHTTLYKARLEAEKKTSGKVIAFLDVDDWWYPEKLERQIILFEDESVGLVYSNCNLYNESQKKYKLFTYLNLPSGYVIKDLAKNYVVLLPTLCIRKEVFSLEGGFNCKYHIIGDYDLVMRIANKYRIETIQDPLSVYRIHKNSETKKYKDLQVQELSLFIESIIKNKIFDRKIIALIKQRFYYIKSSFLAEKHNIKFISYLAEIKGTTNKAKIILKYFKFL